MLGGHAGRALDDEFAFWAQFGVDFMQIGADYATILAPGYMARLLSLKDQYGIKLLMHPRPGGEFLQSPANLAAHSLITEALCYIQELAEQGALIGKAIMHPATYRIPGSRYQTFTEHAAMHNASQFYARLRRHSTPTIVLECVPAPYEGGWGELGYKVEHFAQLALGTGYEFCLDTGHLKLSHMTVQDTAALSLETTCLHLQSNDGTEDQHRPLLRSNFEHWAQIEGMMGEDKYIVIEVKQDMEDIPRVMEYLRHGHIAP